MAFSCCSALMPAVVCQLTCTRLGIDSPHPVQVDEGVKEIVRMLLRCAYGSPLDASSKIPSHSACVEVAVRETAFNPLSSPSASAQPDERIYVAFQQHITFQVGPRETQVAAMAF